LDKALVFEISVRNHLQVRILLGLPIFCHEDMKNIFSFLAIISLVLIPGLAYAEEIGRFDHDEGYGYEFSDDPLNAGGFGANDMMIKVRPRAARTMLIRPRTNFIPELLKSVEDIW
jgi:hypothetical protein